MNLKANCVTMTPQQIKDLGIKINSSKKAIPKEAYTIGLLPNILDPTKIGKPPMETKTKDVPTKIINGPIKSQKINPYLL